ncbi:VOC family protein [Geofilum rubicundum]|uniref:Methylmalonyl-CoA epimerase n=1 Tax=Geofilum rubicundum JCM 15548 TaxID=1236989 RepID=A0A0E9LQX1_9BACT|nr:VOC family protein [Geofilum rubicundum]GAO27644.1 methylmalonyl-CoA epimerase [Geofilum rubicundum JCM 15548]
MKPTHIEHIGIAVKNLEEAIAFYEKVYGLECYAVEEVAEQKVKTAFFMVGQTKIELLESTDLRDLLVNLLKRRGKVFTIWPLLLITFRRAWMRLLKMVLS